MDNYETKYKDALERARKIHSETKFDYEKGMMEEIFPELKESKGERIRTFLIKDIKDTLSSEDFKHYNPEHTKKLEEALAWLEKQGEKKSTDKIEPKFKVGDYLVNDYCKGKVIELTDDAYLLDTEQGIPFSCEHNAHLWTIQDAKDGDVLVSRFKQPFIYNGNYNENYVGAYCGIVCDGSMFIETNSVCQWADNKKIKPATKEQRDLLFKKMKESGYEWNSEKKELKKIEEKPAETTKSEEWWEELSLSLQIQAYLNTASDELYAKDKPLYSEKSIDDIHKCMKMWAKLHHSYFHDGDMKTNESVDFFSVHSKEEVAEIDKRIERKQKEYDAKLRDKMMKVKDFPMTD